MKYLLAFIGGATALILLFNFADQGLLGVAATYVDDEPKLTRFMSDMGYPKIGEWCGEFAASVIKSAGGTPPPALPSRRTGAYMEREMQCRTLATLLWLTEVYRLVQQARTLAS